LAIKSQNVISVPVTIEIKISVSNFCVLRVQGEAGTVIPVQVSDLFQCNLCMF